MNNIVSLSGGKDSTAMFLEMLERNEKIHSVVFFDTEWEFPEMYDHIDRIEKYTGLKIWRLRSVLPFDYWLQARPVISRKSRPEIGIKKGEVYRIGNGWPSVTRRWCTRQKADAIQKFCKPIKDAVSCIGYAADETDRDFSDDKIKRRYPLQEYGITEKDALKICYKHGFTWGGLYEHFHRVSCFCCPLQRIGELKKLYIHFPELWKKMLEMESGIGWRGQRGFRGYATISDIDKRFKKEVLNEIPMSKMEDVQD